MGASSCTVFPASNSNIMLMKQQQHHQQQHQPLSPDQLERQAQLQEAMTCLCEDAIPSNQFDQEQGGGAGGGYEDILSSNNTNTTDIDSNFLMEEDPAIFGTEDDNSYELDELITRVHSILKRGGPTSNDNSISQAAWKELEESFQQCHQMNIQKDKRAEFDHVEAFVTSEQNSGRERRRSARQMESEEEKRLACEVAQLKGLRLQSLRQNNDDDLRWKISNAERAYISRKMVYAKASQVAGTELRWQFSRVRDFLSELHQRRQDDLLKRHRRTMHFQTLVHALKGSEERVVSLDRQITVRLYRKQKSDLNELHLRQTLEEASYLESMMGVLDKIQLCKETAARDVFNLHVENLKKERSNNNRRNDELDLFAASGTLEMAKLVEQYTDEDAQDSEQNTQMQQHVQAMERSKYFDDKNAAKEHAKGIMSVSKLYDTVLWSVASNNLGLTSSGSSMYSSDFGGDDDMDHLMTSMPDEEDIDKEGAAVQHAAATSEMDAMMEDPEEISEQEKRLTPIGKMHSRQLARQLRERERALIQKHKDEIKAEKRAYYHESKALKAKHQAIIDQVVEQSLVDREQWREVITERIEALAARQEALTEQMRKKDLQLMKEALSAEDKRVQEVESTSFLKAQELISAQVFHEVRNALSSVIAMSEITDSLKQDESLTAHDLINNVDDMLDQIGDVVNYALKMLNEILDVSKINSGAFIPHKEAFDLNDIVARATRMQRSKASKIELAFKPMIQPCIAVSDPSIVERIVATLISNAVKFTTAGAVETFVCPIEAVGNMDCNYEQREENSGSVQSNSTSRSCNTLSTASISSVSEESCRSNQVFGGAPNTHSPSRIIDEACDTLPLANKKMKMVAIGVADTGVGLDEGVLQSSKFVISTSRAKGSNKHGAQNTGFGLYHAHLQTRALNTQLQLAKIEDCWDILNDDMLKARRQYDDMIKCNGDNDISESESSSFKYADIPGRGSILYFTVPVYEDGIAADNALQSSIEEVSLESGESLIGEYIFRPLPAPNSNGTFRILVADDVLMLRKGMVHMIGKLWGEHFPHCPVSISTTCTAEDMLRAASSQPFDLIICDQNFSEDIDHLNVMSPEECASGERQNVRFNSEGSPSNEEIRKDVSEFFKSERFDIQENDGSLLGLTALMQLVECDAPAFPLPTLMVVSGHKIDTKEGSGIIVAQKPLKHSEFIACLENHSHDLLRAGKCKRKKRRRHDDSSTTKTRNDHDRETLVNLHGCQMFVRSEDEQYGGDGEESICSQMK